METLTTKKLRALPRVWAKFYKLADGENFFIGSDRAIKVAFCGFRRYARPNCFVNDWGKQSKFEFIAPWRRVKTDVFIRDARLDSKSSLPAWTARNTRFVKEHPTLFRGPVTTLDARTLPIEQTGPSA